ncbi:hypothetical protein, partial [Paracoccus aerius]|uniref:hypothetical protein n=1 Tax=Paracoccus aerius TaxID=1915382 RepID=UPI001E43921D
MSFKSEATARMKAKPDLTLNDLVGERADHHGIAIHRVSVSRFLRGLGLTHKKEPASLEQKRSQIRQARHIWVTSLMRSALTRLGFIGETSLTTNMAEATGWSPKARALSTMCPLATETPRPSSPPCAMTGWT